jgi:hypothetical protein
MHKYLHADQLRKYENSLSVTLIWISCIYIYLNFVLKHTASTAIFDYLEKIILHCISLGFLGSTNKFLGAKFYLRSYNCSAAINLEATWILWLS